MHAQMRRVLFSTALILTLTCGAYGAAALAAGAPQPPRPPGSATADSFEPALAERWAAYEAARARRDAAIKAVRAAAAGPERTAAIAEASARAKEVEAITTGMLEVVGKMVDAAPDDPRWSGSWQRIEWLHDEAAAVAVLAENDERRQRWVERAVAGDPKAIRQMASLAEWDVGALRKLVDMNYLLHRMDAAEFVRQVVGAGPGEIDLIDDDLPVVPLADLSLAKRDNEARLQDARRELRHWEAMAFVPERAELLAVLRQGLDQLPPGERGWLERAIEYFEAPPEPSEENEPIEEQRLDQRNSIYRAVMRLEDLLENAAARDAPEVPAVEPGADDTQAALVAVEVLREELGNGGMRTLLDPQSGTSKQLDLLNQHIEVSPPDPTGNALQPRAQAAGPANQGATGAAAGIGQASPPLAGSAGTPAPAGTSPSACGHNNGAASNAMTAPCTPEPATCNGQSMHGAHVTCEPELTMEPESIQMPEPEDPQEPRCAGSRAKEGICEEPDPAHQPESIRMPEREDPQEPPCAGSRAKEGICEEPGRNRPGEVQATQPTDEQWTSVNNNTLLVSGGAPIQPPNAALAASLNAQTQPPGQQPPQPEPTLPRADTMWGDELTTIEGDKPNGSGAPTQQWNQPVVGVPVLGATMEIQLPTIGQATSNGSGNTQSSTWLSDPDSTTGNWDGLFDGQAGSSTSTSESSILDAARPCPTAC